MFHSDRRDPIQIDTVGIMMIALAIFILLSGCPAIQTWENLTPKAKATWLMSVYNKEFSDYVAQAAQPDQLTEAQKAVLKAKKIVLRKAWPLIKFYSAMVSNGVASSDAERAALEAVRELIAVTAEEVANG